jgi:DNA-binding NarL/FixJ family response regulator
MEGDGVRGLAVAEVGGRPLVQRHQQPGDAPAQRRERVFDARRHLGVGTALHEAAFYEEDYALDLIGERPEGVGYLLKERVGDVEAFAEAVGRVAAGGSALDPEVVGRMLGRRRADGPLDALSPREREVLGAVAEGKSNRGIAEALFISDAAVEKHVTHIFSKLGLNQSPNEHRRVLAALTYLRSARA